MGDTNPNFKADELKPELEKLAEKNLDGATFASKRGTINRLGIKCLTNSTCKF